MFDPPRSDRTRRFIAYTKIKKL